MTQVAPIPLQQSFWNQWNSSTREQKVEEISLRQARVVRGWLEALGRTDLEILEVGCGAGWLCPELMPFGRVTGTDLSDEVLNRAKQRMPEVNFVAGDFMSLEFATFDVVVTLEVLSHVADQPAFISKLASHIRPGGYLMMATQNRPVLQKFNNIPPPKPGQLRRWVDQSELRNLLEPKFEVLELFSVTPKANRGIMRWVNSRKVNWPIRALVGERFEDLKEAMGLGWTLMTLARKPAT
jgi:2-polyprenyl-3-methyl-5-hydroxy-6-metoxy-1,4-benzoquinol methylase